MVELNGKSAAEREALDAQLHKAKTQLEGLKLALAAAALEAGGGSGASAEDTKRDAEEAAAERQEPLPRDPTTWLNFTYTVDDQGSLVSFSRKPGSAVKPFDGDGARAVMALVKQVARLYRQRKALREDQASAGRNLNNASKVMEAMEAEHVSINSQIDAMVGTIQRVKATHKLVGVVSAPPPKPEDARLLDRLQVVGHMLDSLEAELNFRAQFAPPSGPAAGGSPQHNTNSSRRTSGSGEVVEPAGSAAGSKPGSRAGAPRSSASNVKSIYSQSLAVGGGRAPSGGRPVVKTAAGSASSTMRSR